MTTTSETVLPCPACNSADGIDQADGTRFCLACRNTWNPRETPIRPALALVREPELTADDVLGPPECDPLAGYHSTPHTCGLHEGELDYEPSVCDQCGRSDPHTHELEPGPWSSVESEAFLEQLIGTRVLLEGGQWVTLVGFVDEDHVEILFDSELPETYASTVRVACEEPDGTSTHVAFVWATDKPHAPTDAEEAAVLDVALRDPQLKILGASIESRNWPPATVVNFADVIRHGNVTELEPEPELELDDETAMLVGDAVLTFACLIIEAGLVSLKGEGAAAELVPSPTGFLPDDADAIPLLEQGAATAVAMLCKAFDLPRNIVANAIEAVRLSIGEGHNNGGNTQ